MQSCIKNPGLPQNFKNSRFNIGLTNSPIGKGSADLIDIFIDHLGNAQDATKGKGVLIVGFGDTVSEIVAVAHALPNVSRLYCAEAIGEHIDQAARTIETTLPLLRGRITFCHAVLSDLSPIGDESIALMLGFGLSIHDGAAANACEIIRVLQPGGMACLAVDVRSEIQKAVVEHLSQRGTVSAPTPFYVLFQKAGTPIFQQRLGALNLAAR